MNGDWFAGRLRELRLKAGLTQEQLAERAGVKRDAVARWERGVREPSWSNVLAICSALGVSSEEFNKAPADAPFRRPGRPPGPKVASPLGDGEPESDAGRSVPPVGRREAGETGIPPR